MGIATELADMVFPRWCAGCGAWDTSLCERCARELGAWREVSGRAPYLNVVRVERWDPAGPADVEPIFPVWSLGEYEGRLRATILSWKNAIDGGLTASVCRIVRQRVACQCRRQAERPSRTWISGVAGGGAIAVVPAPSRWTRRHDGRFVVGHVARAVAEGFAEAGVSAPVRDVLATGRSPAGASILGRGAKARSIRLVRPFPETSCVLVDDVLTTGATLASCARAMPAARVLGALVLAAAADPRHGRNM